MYSLEPFGKLARRDTRVALQSRAKGKDYVSEGSAIFASRTCHLRPWKKGEGRNKETRYACTRLDDIRDIRVQDKCRSLKATGIRDTPILRTCGRN